VAELRAKVAKLEVQIALKAPPVQDGGDVSAWLEEVKPGYGARFAKALRQAGYEDFQDLSSIPCQGLKEEADQIAKQLKFAGAKAPQERRIRDALALLVRNASTAPALRMDSARSAPIAAGASIEEWLDNIQVGFGARFSNAFSRLGYETADDLAHAQPLSPRAEAAWETEMDSICFHLSTLGAKQPQLRQIREALHSLAHPRNGAASGDYAKCATDGAADDEELRRALQESLRCPAENASMAPVCGTEVAICQTDGAATAQSSNKVAGYSHDRDSEDLGESDSAVLMAEVVAAPTSTKVYLPAD